MGPPPKRQRSASVICVALLAVFAFAQVSSADDTQDSTTGAAVPATETYVIPMRAFTSVNALLDNWLSGVFVQDHDDRFASYYVGVKAAFSLDYRPAKMAKLFLTGSFSPMIAVNALRAPKDGLCLADCSATGGYATVGAGTGDYNFAYDLRTGVGASIALSDALNLTGQTGVLYNNQAPLSLLQNPNGASRTTLSPSWGHFSRISFEWMF